MGNAFSVADPYLFNVSNWAPLMKVDMPGFANIAAFRAHMSQRPAVQAAMKAEGLIKSFHFQWMTAWGRKTKTGHKGPFLQ